jgi:transposase
MDRQAYPTDLTDVERTFAWLGKHRRLSKEYEAWADTREATIYPRWFT